MSEDRSLVTYSAGENDAFLVIDEATPRKFFSQMPNLADDMGLSPQAYRLYGHFRRVAGEEGKCWQSGENIAEICRMSTGAVSAAKQELASTSPPLIRIERKPRAEGGYYHEVYLTDIWQINNDFYSGKPVNIVRADELIQRKNTQNDGLVSKCEGAPSIYETKKNPVKEEPNTCNLQETQIAGATESYGIQPEIKKAVSPLLAWEMLGSTRPSTDQQLRSRDALSSSASAKLSQHTALAWTPPPDLVDAYQVFVDCFGREPFENERSGWIKDLRIYVGGYHATADEIKAAFDMSRKQRLSVKKPGSLFWAFDELRAKRSPAFMQNKSSENYGIASL